MSKSPTQPTPARRMSTRRLVIVAIAGVVVLTGTFVAGGLAQRDSPSASTAQESGSASEPLDLSRRLEGDPAALGDVDAPVVIVEYADYRCPFCGVFARDTLPTLVEEYVDAGTVRIEWRDLPVFGEESVNAAVAARAAGAQGLFWEYSKAIFAGAPERGHPELPRERLIELATEIGVPDLDRFIADLDSADHLAVVNADQAEAQQLGISSTPIFVVNESPISGAQPLDVFRQVIDAELAKVQ